MLSAVIAPWLQTDIKSHPVVTNPTWTFTELMKAISANMVKSITASGNHVWATLKVGLVVDKTTFHVVQSYLPNWDLSGFQNTLNVHNVSVQVIPASTASGSGGGMTPFFVGLILALPLLLLGLMIMIGRKAGKGGMGGMQQRRGPGAPGGSMFTKPTLNISPGRSATQQVEASSKKDEETTNDHKGWVLSRLVKRAHHHFRLPAGEEKKEVKEVVAAPVVTFAQVGGIDEVRGELEEIVDFLKAPERYARLGAEVPRGILLVGGPGTGKTLLARAVAGEAGVTFIAVSGSQFVEMYVGLGASRIHNTFEQARAVAPCIVFIDEIDAVGKKRSGGGADSHEYDHTLNQLLTEMDGFNRQANVVVMAATNRLDVLDEALTRPGRFDRKVMVHAPDVQGREMILKIHTANIPLAADVSLNEWAKQTTGFVGANLKNLVNEAAIWAARKGLAEVPREAFHYAFQKDILGPVRNVLMSQSAKERTAYHEAGHALMGMLTPGADPVEVVSILPRGMSLGVTVSRPEEDRHTYTYKELGAMVLTALGGRVAEEIHYGDDISTGASDDLSKATKLVRQMVYSWGMSDLGPANLLAVDQEHAQSGMIGRAISDTTARAVDEQMDSVLRRFLLETRHQLQANQHHLVALANALLERESLTGDEIKKILCIPVSARRRFKVEAERADTKAKPDVRLVSFPPAEVAVLNSHRSRLPRWGWWRRGRKNVAPQKETATS